MFEEPLVEQFIRLCEEWRQRVMERGGENPVWSVSSVDGYRLQVILRNGTRWILNRNHSAGGALKSSSATNFRDRRVYKMKGRNKEKE